MGKHQIIYTSCMRGIDGVNDGQQIFSYDSNFKGSKSDEVRALFGYQLPSLRDGIVMNEEIALTMPKAFQFRTLNSGECAVTLNTYLGRDYMGSSGRFGNHLSHSIICREEEFDIYPCELYGGPALRSSMDYEEVNNPNPPEYLEEAQLEAGYEVSIETVIEFLETDDNLLHYKKMLYAMLFFKKDRKRLIICDKPENIIMWIAAIEYALPLNLARKINFTTYEFDPELSASQICGVIPEGTKYNIERYKSLNNYYVFDFISGSIENLDTSNEYFNFIDTAMSFSYDLVEKFHDYINNRFNYTEADEKMLDAYTIYQMNSEGFININNKRFKSAVEFIKKYGNREAKNELTAAILENIDHVNKVNTEFSLSIINYLLESFDLLSEEAKKIVKNIIIRKILSELSKNRTSENGFLELYDTIDKLAKTINVNFANELMKNNNREQLVEIMNETAANWKINFIIRIISEFVIESKMSVDELYPDMPIGKLYYSIFESIYPADRNNGINLIKNIFAQFEKHELYLVNMALNIEGYMIDLQLREVDKEQLWNMFYLIVVNMHDKQINKIYSVFAESSRYEEMFIIYKKCMIEQKDIQSAGRVFDNIVQSWFNRNKEFRDKYIEDVIDVYAYYINNKVNSNEYESIERYQSKLLKITMDNEVYGKSTNKLIEAAIKDIPLENLKRKDARLVKELVDYKYYTKEKEIDGKLLLLTVGIIFDESSNRRSIGKVIDEIKELTSGNEINLEGLGENDSDSYIEWIISLLLEYKLDLDNMTEVYRLFGMGKSLSNKYMSYFSRQYYKKCKEDDDYADLWQLTGFIFANGDYKDISGLGKIVSKLNKQNLKKLDQNVKYRFEEQADFMEYWEEIVTDINSKNQFIDKVFGIFRRK